MERLDLEAFDPAVELIAHVDAPAAGLVEVLFAANLCERGVFLAAGADECPWLLPDTCFQVTVALAADEPDAVDLRVRARARVAWRVDDLSPAPGIGALFEEIEPADRDSLRAMLMGARP